MKLLIYTIIIIFFITLNSQLSEPPSTANLSVKIYAQSVELCAAAAKTYIVKANEGIGAERIKNVVIR